MMKLPKEGVAPSSAKIKILITALIVALLLVAGAASYFYFQLREFQKNPQQNSEREVQELIDRVSTLIVLPEDEVPTVATVSDPGELKDQPFFTSAKKGYKVLIYTTAKKAILYDPFEHKIIEIAPINLGQPAQ